MLPLLLRIGAALAVLAILVPFTQELFLGWLGAPPEFWPVGVQGLLLRADIGIIGWLAIDTYTRLIRAGDRAVLAILPVDPAQVVRFEMLRLAWERWFLVPAAAALLLPMAAVDPLYWGLAVLQLLGCWVLSLSASAMVVLWAVDAAHSPAMRPFLDLVRGNNHPAQAAFLYAPAVVLLGVGLVLQGSGMGVVWLHEGDALGALMLLVPLGVAALCWLPVPGLAQRNWFRAGQAMAEVDARYAAIEDPDEVQRVYFDWAVRFLPDELGRYVLLDLRHGWRARRSWVMGAWLAGFASLVAAWTADPAGPGRAASIAALGAWILAAVVFPLHSGEPTFLRQVLPSPPAKLIGRAVAVTLWLQPVIWLGALATAIRQGGAAFVLVFGASALSALLAALLATLCSRRGGAVLYGPVAALGALVVVLGVGGAG